MPSFLDLLDDQDKRAIIKPDVAVPPTVSPAQRASNGGDRRGTGKASFLDLLDDDIPLQSPTAISPPASEVAPATAFEYPGATSFPTSSTLPEEPRFLEKRRAYTRKLTSQANDFSLPEGLRKKASVALREAQQLPESQTSDWEKFKQSPVGQQIGQHGLLFGSVTATLNAVSESTSLPPAVKKTAKGTLTSLEKKLAVFEDPTRRRGRIEHTVEEIISGAFPGMYKAKGPEYAGTFNTVVDGVAHLIGMGISLGAIEKLVVSKGFGPISRLAKTKRAQQAIAMLGKHKEIAMVALKEAETFGLYRAMAPPKEEGLINIAKEKAGQFGIGSMEGVFFAAVGGASKKGVSTLLPRLRPELKSAVGTSAAFAGISGLQPTETSFTEDPLQATIERLQNMGVGFMTGALLSAVKLGPRVFESATQKLSRTNRGSAEEFVAMSEIMNLADAKLKESGYKFTTEDIIKGRAPRQVQVKAEAVVPEGVQRDLIKPLPTKAGRAKILPKKITRQQIKLIKATEGEIKAGKDVYQNILVKLTEGKTSIKNISKYEASRYIDALKDLGKRPRIAEKPPEKTLFTATKGKGRAKPVILPKTPARVPPETKIEPPVPTAPPKVGVKKLIVEKRPKNIPEKIPTEPAPAETSEATAELKKFEQKIPKKADLKPGETIAKGADNIRHLLKYKVVDLKDIIRDEKFQPRDMTREGIKVRAQKIAAEFDIEDALAPTRTLSLGTEIITKNKKLLAGFARTEAKKIIAGANPTQKKAIIAEVLKEAKARGASLKGVKKMEFPVLVREAQVPELYGNVADQSNVGVVSGESAAESIQRNIAKLRPEWIQELKVVGKTVEEALLSPSNKEVVGKIRNVLPFAEQNKMIDETGAPSQEFVKWAKGAIFSKAYKGDKFLISQLTEKTDVNIKNVINAMKDASPTAASVNALPVKKSLRIDNDLVVVAKKMVALRHQGISVDEAVNQTGFSFGVNLTPDQVKIIKFIDANKGSKPKIQAFIERYHELLRQAPQEGQGTMFKESESTKSSLIEMATESPQQGLFVDKPGDTEVSFLGMAKVHGAGKRVFDFFKKITEPARRPPGEEPSIIPISEVTKLSPEKIPAISYSASGENSLSPRKVMQIKEGTYRTLVDIEKAKGTKGRKAIKSGEPITVYRADPDPHTIALPGAEVFLSKELAQKAGQGKIRSISLPPSEIIKRGDSFLYRPRNEQAGYERLVQHTIGPFLGHETILSKSQSLKVGARKHGREVLTRALVEAFDVYGFQTSLNKSVFEAAKKSFLAENPTSKIKAAGRFLKNRPVPALESLTSDLENVSNFPTIEKWAENLNKKYNGKPNSRATIVWYQKLMDAAWELKNVAQAKIGEPLTPRRKFYVQWVKTEQGMEALRTEDNRKFKLSPSLAADPTAKERLSTGKDRRMDPFELAERHLNLAQRTITFSKEAQDFTRLFSALKPVLDKPERHIFEEFFRVVTSSDIPNADKVANKTLERAKITPLLNAVLKPLGRSLGRNPAGKISGIIGRAEVESVLSGRPKPVIRNFFQRVQGWTLASPEAIVKGATLEDPPELKALMRNSPGLNKLKLEAGVGVEEFAGRSGGMRAFSARHIGNIENNMRVAYWQGKQMERLGLWKTSDTIMNMEVLPDTGQFVYDALGRPRIFNSAAGRTALRFNSWWINKSVHYIPEHMERFWHGRTGWGAPVTRRMRATSAATLLLESGQMPGMAALKGYAAYRGVSHLLGQMGMRKIIPGKLEDVGGIELQAARNLYNAFQAKDDTKSAFYFKKAYEQFLFTKIPRRGLVNDLMRSRQRGPQNLFLYPTEEQMEAERKIWLRNRRRSNARKRAAKRLLLSN